jgi:hypothetical protein
VAGSFRGSAITAAAIVACASAAVVAHALPAPEELAPDRVAVVDRAPGGHGTITLAEFRHGLVLAAAGKGRRSLPKAGGPAYEVIQKEAVDSLLEGAWIYGQADEWGISVSRRQVSRELAQLKRESFKSGAEFRDFLRENRYTRHDVNERVEIQVIATRLQHRLVRQFRREGKTSRKAEQRAFTEFVQEFNAKWRARTVCAPRYATERCSNGPPAPR